MSKVRKRGEQIRQFILENVEENQRDVATLASQEFGISRQAVNKHIHHLVDQKALVIKGSTRSRIYQLHPQVKWMETYDLNSNLAEDIVWDSDIKPLVSDLPDNVRDIWLYGFTEMLNNAIDHSSGQAVIVQLQRTAIDTQIIINDDGEGIFKKIQRELQLHDERHAVLELAKGKLTTDPDRHTGQGIFFTSRMFDEFAILSGSIYFSHEFNKAEDWILERDGFKSGTTVFMKLNNNTSRTSKQVFDSFSSGDDYAFTKTVVPVRLAQYGNERLVSRSQAKRLLAGVDKFKVVVFDFAGVD
ncbi:MAG: ATP-binding protein, partial [Nodosilinea sp.]